MINKILFFLFLSAFFWGCGKIDPMKQEIVNIVNMDEIYLAEKGESKNSETVPADFYYAKDTLYISDQKNNRVLGIDEENEIFIEIGNVIEGQAVQANEYWEKELEEFLSSFQSSEEFEKKKKVRTQPRKKVKEKYAFVKIGKIITDFQENVYVSHFNEKGLEILKFNSDGKFIYRIGEEGKDNPYFKPDTLIIDMMVSKENGLWIKYQDQENLKIRYYNDFGKNLLYYNIEAVKEAVNGFLEKKENQYYKIEDIFPLSASNEIASIINVYEKDSGSYRVSKKYFFEINRDYNVINYWDFESKNQQVFNLDADDNILCFSYFSDEKAPILLTYNSKGNKTLEKKISLQKFNYKRIYVSMTQEGNIIGAFMKKNKIYFVLWK
ncbi:MAG TPA: hypothetical protein DHW82_08095 [Spirochaetia bacterium]|nr:MAG: hypothetical protein A2Y41_06725 [Spirochaetes bacterium GWB1_36_13]HCL56954.1 hypothetical protein [Spirochaetia bacterium]